jgi:hypothetical protein
MPHVEETERCLQVIGDFLAEHDKGARRSTKSTTTKRPSREKRRRR